MPYTCPDCGRIYATQDTCSVDACYVRSLIRAESDEFWTEAAALHERMERVGDLSTDEMSRLDFCEGYANGLLRAIHIAKETRPND